MDMTILTKYRTLMPISLMMDRTISFHMQRHLGSSVIFSNFLHSGSSQSSNANDLNGHNLNRSLICGRSTRHTSSHTNSAYSTSRRYVLTPHIWITHSAVFKYSTSVFIPQNTTISVCNLSFRDHLFFVQKKFKHTKKSTWSSEEHEPSEDDITDEEFDAEDIHFEEDKDWPPNYRDIKGHMKNLRLDSMVGFGLGMNRSKVEDYFLSSKLKLNGGRVLKKSIKLGSGDYVDVIVDHHEGFMTVKRVRVVDVKLRADPTKAIVYLRVWRGGAKVPVVKEKYTRNS